MKKTVDFADGAVWLNVNEFAARQNRPTITIYKWVNNGFIVELGFLLRYDWTGHILIGIPRQHNAYAQFVSS